MLKNFVSIDFETFYAQRVTACSVGMVKYINSIPTDTYYSKICPPWEYEGIKGEPCTHIHGFVMQDLINERRFPIVLREMEEFIGNLPLVAHNACVERDCILKTCEYYKIDTVLRQQALNINDTLQYSRKVVDPLFNFTQKSFTHSVDMLCEVYKVDVDTTRHHDALADARMCGDLFVKLQTIVEGYSSHQIFKTDYKVPDINTQIIKEKHTGPEDLVEFLNSCGGSNPNPFEDSKVKLDIEGFLNSEKVKVKI